MRILYITDQIYLHGGAEKILIQKLNYWADVFGYDVLLITISQNGRKPFFALSSKVRVIDLGIANLSFYSPVNLWKLRRNIMRLKSKIHGFKPDAIFLITLGFVRYILPFISGNIPIYNEYHTSYYGFQLGYEKLSPLKQMRKKLQYALIRQVEKQFTGIVFLNQEEYDHYNLKNGIIIPNFFDASADVGQIAKKRQAISLGRLTYQKGYDLLIDAWGIVSKSAPDWTLEIFGNGEDRDILQSRIEQKNLQHVIHLNPATDKVNEKLSESAFYVMSSRFETFPMVLLEAMSNGLPTVSFKCPSGPASMLTDGEDGLLVESGNIPVLAEKILSLINNGDQRIHMGENASRNVTKFSPEIIMAKWNDLVLANG